MVNNLSAPQTLGQLSEKELRDIRRMRAVIGSFQPAYYCLECGWFGRFNVTMSNRELEEAVLKDMSDAHPELLEDKQEDDEEIYDIE